MRTRRRQPLGVRAPRSAGTRADVLSWGEDAVRLWRRRHGRVAARPHAPRRRAGRGASWGRARSAATRAASELGRDGAVRLWDAATGRELLAPMRHEEGAAQGRRGAAFSRDEGRVLSWGGTRRGAAVGRRTGRDAARPHAPRGGPSGWRRGAPRSAATRAASELGGTARCGVGRRPAAASCSPPCATGRASGARGRRVQPRRGPRPELGRRRRCRLWDISRLPAGNLLEVACKLLPSRSVGHRRPLRHSDHRPYL
jgi:hypothetical protein